MKRQNLKTFRTDTKKKTTTFPGKEIICKYDRNLFDKMMILVQCRQMDVKHVLTYCLDPVPWSSATVDGSLSQTVKSRLMHILTDSVDPAIEHSSKCMLHC